MSDFEQSGMVFKVRQTFTIEKVRVSRWAAVRRLLRQASLLDWRGVKSAARVVWTGMDHPYRGVTYNAGV
jgi:hypothetical protein